MSKRLSAALLVAVCSACLLAASNVSAQTGTELTKLLIQSGYPQEWEAGPPASSVPDWARPGQIRFSRWDGGPIETAKAFLSGWPGFNPPIPDYLDVMTNWYQPSTLQLLRDANMNLVWVTFSNGFSIPSEECQRKILRQYIDECHKQGIRIMAYESVTNMFVEDMFERVPESKSWLALGADGKAVPYGAANYSKIGRVTRLLADLSNPQWRDYVKRRIDLAIEAGADGIFYDNCISSHGQLADIFREIMPYSLSKKKDFLVMANFHLTDFILNRLVNAISTEEGGEAGIFSEKNLKDTRNRWLSERDMMLPIEGGYLANNIGRFRMFENLSEGWKPVMIESRIREVGIPETHVMAPHRHKVVLAESMMFNVANEQFVEGRFAAGLWHREPEIMEAWKAIGQYNEFFANHLEYYRGTKSAATLAIVLDNTSDGEAVLNGLAGRNVLYHILYEHELSPEKLKPYAAVALLKAEMVRDRAMSALEDYVIGGGKLFITEESASKDENGQYRGRPAWLEQKHEKGEVTPWKRVPPIDELAAALRAADRPPLVRVEAPAGVLYNVRRQPETGRLMVHLLNYLPRPVDKVIVTIQGKHERARLVTPDGQDEKPLAVRATDEATEIEVPGVKIYSLLALEPEG